MARSPISPRLRKWLLAVGVVFASVLALEVVIGPKDGAADSIAAEPVVRHRAAGVRIAPSPLIAADDLDQKIVLVNQRAQRGTQVEDLFAPRSWQAQAPPPAPPPPPPKPAAPPFPFTYMGSMIEDGRRTVFLTSGDRIVAVKVADIIDGTYQIESITHSQMTLTYLPLKQQQTIALGEIR